MNLTGNGIKFTSQGKVEIQLKKDPQSGKIWGTVSDSGIGISQENLKKLFERFTQADSSITRKYGGTGLGLSITKQLVELMGGKIWAESSEGKGSHFHFILPFDPIDSVSNPVGEQPVQKPIEDLRPLKLLLVDDYEQNRLLILSYLKNTPYQIETASNGIDAFEKVKQKAFDLVLMDMQMPVMDGFTATKKIRDWEKSEGRIRTPIIALSANALKEEVQRGMDQGCDGYLTKPVRKMDLLDAIFKTAKKSEPKK